MSLGNLVPSKFNIDVISKNDLVLANYTNENVLIQTNPEVPYWDYLKDDVIDYVAQASENIYYADGGLYKALAKNNAIREVMSDAVRWHLKGTGTQKVISLENMMSGNPTPGINNSIVLIKLNKNIFQSSDTLYPEHEPSLRFSVQGNPVHDGTGWVYSLKLHDRRYNSYVPTQYLAPHIIWKADGGSVSEGSYEWGSSYKSGTSLLTYESTLTSFAMQHETTDKGWLESVRLRFMKDRNTQDMKYPELTLPFSEVEWLAQARYMREHKLFWGRSAGRNIEDPSTGLYRRIGEGAIEFYEDGNLRGYHRNKFSTDFLKDIFRKFFYGRVKPGNANIIIQSGLGLMGLVDKALTDSVDRINIERRYDDYIKGGATYPGSMTPGKHITAPTFLGFDLKPYGTVKFVHLPLLDDFESHGGRVDRKTGMPETSFWGFVNDIGLGSGNNMELLRLKNSEIYAHVCGVLSPVGFINQRNTGYQASHQGRFYTTHVGVTEGVRVKDTKKTMWLHPAERF